MAARETSFLSVPPHPRHPSGGSKNPSSPFKSPTLHTRDIHWIHDETRGPDDPQLASGGPARRELALDTFPSSSIERRCALPPVCRVDHPLFHFTLQYIVTGPSLMPRPNSVSTRWLTIVFPGARPVQKNKALIVILKERRLSCLMFRHTSFTMEPILFTL